MTKTSSIQVLSAGAVEGVIAQLAKQFAFETGHAVKLVFGTVGEIYDRLRTESADVVIMSAPAIDEAIDQGRVIATSRIHIARTGIGVLVRTGEPMRYIATPDSLAETLISSTTVAYPDPEKGSTAGRHVATILGQLGIADVMRAKSIMCANGFETCKAVAEGKAKLGIAMISEIMSMKKVELVGPLPKSLQLVTTYTIGVATKTNAVDAAREFVKFVTGADGKIFTDAGLNCK